MDSLDEIFALFTRERRRFALYYLDNADGAVPIDELAEQIREWETDPEREEVPDDEYEETLIELEHNHLPKIEDVDHVEYDRTNEQIRISGLSSEVDVLLSVTKAIERPSETNDIAFERRN